jgi:predicted  nucleic acid-binding Zn-ribbon protein
VSVQLTKLLAATEEQASLRSKENYDQVDRRCTEMEEKHLKSHRDLENAIDKVQKAVKQLSEQREVQHSGKSGSAGMQALEHKVSRLSEREDTARAEASASQERVFRLQASMAGLVTRIAATERVVQRFDALEGRVSSIEREMKREARLRKERAEKASITVDLSGQSKPRLAHTTEPLLRRTRCGGVGVCAKRVGD